MTDIEILKFEADWCSPCATQSDILEGFDAAPVTEIDIDANQELAQEYNVRGIPTLVIEEDGEEVERFSGITPLDIIEDAIES